MEKKIIIHEGLYLEEIRGASTPNFPAAFSFLLRRVQKDWTSWGAAPHWNEWSNHQHLLGKYAHHCYSDADNCLLYHCEKKRLSFLAQVISPNKTKISDANQKKKTDLLIFFLGWGDFLCRKHIFPNKYVTSRKRLAIFAPFSSTVSYALSHSMILFVWEVERSP